MEMIVKQENELQTLRAEFDLLRSELALRMELSSELEAQVQTLEKKVHAAEEACGAAHKLSSALEEKKSLADQVEESDRSMIEFMMVWFITADCTWNAEVKHLLIVCVSVCVFVFVFFQLAHLSEERETLTLQLQTSKCQLADVMEMLEGLEMAKGTN